jgi:hypothetical protein
MIRIIIFQHSILCIIINLLYLENHTDVGLLNGGSGHIQSLLVKTPRSLTMESIATIVNFRTKLNTSI